VVREGECLIVSGRLFQVSAETQLMEHRPKFVFNKRYLKEVLVSGTQNTGRLIGV